MRSRRRVRRWQDQRPSERETPGQPPRASFGTAHPPGGKTATSDAAAVAVQQDSAEPGAELPENRREPVTLSSASDVARHRWRAHVRQSAATLATASALTWMMRTDASALPG